MPETIDEVIKEVIIDEVMYDPEGLDTCVGCE